MWHGNNDHNLNSLVAGATTCTLLIYLICNYTGCPVAGCAARFALSPSYAQTFPCHQLTQEVQKQHTHMIHDVIITNITPVALHHCTRIDKCIYLTAQLHQVEPYMISRSHGHPLIKAYGHPLIKVNKRLTRHPSKRN